MAHVIVLDSISEDVFVCGICKSVYNSLPIFLEHKSIKCSYTILAENNSTTIVESTDFPNSFYVEDATLEPNKEQSNAGTIKDDHTCSKELKCTKCNKQFKKMKSLHLHTKIHNEKPYQCPICGRCFNQNSHLQRHINSHKVWPYGVNQTTAKTVEADLLCYSCSYCNIALSNYSQYKIHLKSHWPLKKFKCIQGDCMDVYDTVESLLQHVNSSHEKLVYLCHICSAISICLEEHAVHQASHSNSDKIKVKKKKILKCPQCDAEFYKKEKLALHMVTEDHKKVCIHCNKIFASDKRLRLHLQIHRKLKPFLCNICNSSFHMKKYLSSHMLKHGNRQFKCTICKYMFKRSDLLQRHMRLHQVNKLFKCPFKESMNCMKEFSRSDKLKSHIKSHVRYMTINKAK